MGIIIFLAGFLFFVAIPSHGVNTRTSENLLDLIHLDDHPLAVCNDGTTAVYYRKPLNTNQETKKILIYMKGGGFCVPHIPGMSLSLYKACIQIATPNQPESPYSLLGLGSFISIFNPIFLSFS